MFKITNVRNIISIILIIIAELHLYKIYQIDVDGLLLLNLFFVIVFVAIADQMDFMGWTLRDVLFAILLFLLIIASNYIFYQRTQAVFGFSFEHIYYLSLMFFLVLIPYSNSYKEKAVASGLFLLLVMPIFFNQTLNRNGAAFNGVAQAYMQFYLIIFTVYLALKYVDITKPDFKFFITSSLIAYFCLVGQFGYLVYISLTLMLFRKDFKYAPLFLLPLLIIVVVIYFLGPILLTTFMVQLKDGNLFLLVLGILASIYIGWSCINLKEYLFANALLIVLLNLIGLLVIKNQSYSVVLLDLLPFILISLEDKVNQNNVSDVINIK